MHEPAVREDEGEPSMGRSVAQKVERLERALEEQRVAANAAEGEVVAVARRKVEDQRLQFESELALREESEAALQSALREVAEQARLREAEATRRPRSAPSSVPEISGQSGRVPGDPGTPRGTGCLVGQESKSAIPSSRCKLRNLR